MVRSKVNGKDVSDNSQAIAQAYLPQVLLLLPKAEDELSDKSNNTPIKSYMMY